MREIPMQDLDKIDFDILNVTADDCENLEQIYLGVCYDVLPGDGANGADTHSYRPVTGAPLLTEVADRVRQLVERGLLKIVMNEEGRPWQARNDLSYVWRAWFSMTPQGHSAWEASEHMVEQDQTR
jgi:hypothetical protein